MASMATQLLRDLRRLAEDRGSVVRWYVHQTRLAGYWRDYRFTLPLPRIRTQTRNMMLVLIALAVLLPLVTWAAILQSIPSIYVAQADRVQPPPDSTLFHQRWANTSSEPLPRSIRTIPIRPETESAPAPPPKLAVYDQLPTIEESPTVAPRQPRMRKYKRIHVRAAALDICARHGMHKQYYQRGNWKGWRCRK